MKNILALSCILLFSLSAGAGTKKNARQPKSMVPLQQCTINDIDRCEYVPTYREVPVTETPLFKQSWGTVFVASTPVEEGEHVNGVELKVSIQCSGKDKKVVFKERLCGYQKFSAYPDLQIKAFFVDYNPLLNISENGETISVLTRIPNAQGECKTDKTLRIPISCPKASKR